MRGHVEALERGMDEVAAQGRALTGVFIDADGVPLQAVLPLVAAVRSRRLCSAYVMSDLLRPLHSSRLLFTLFEAPVMRIRDKAPNGTVRRAKRALDLALSSIGIVVTLPAMAVIAAAIKLSSRGPVFYRHERVGLRGRPFTFLKFRTMAVDNDASMHRDLVTDFVRGDAAGPRLPRPRGTRAAVQDRRRRPRDRGLAACCAATRSTSCRSSGTCVRGDMSLVGPRPPLPYEVAEFTRVAAPAAARRAGRLRSVAGRRPQPGELRRDGLPGRLLQRQPVAALRRPHLPAHGGRGLQRPRGDVSERPT